MARRNSYGKRRRAGFLGWLSNLSITGWLILVTSIISIFVFLFVGINCTLEECVIYDYVALKPSSILAGQFLWTLLTHVFVHGGPFHLFINMFVLFSLGRLSERIIGRKRFFWFYVLSGVFAGALTVVFSGYFGIGFGERIFGSPDIFMVGASGAIFAIAGLFVMLLPKLKFMIIFLPFFSLPAYVMVPLVLGVTWIISIFADLPIGNMAHFGGFLAGIGYGYYLRVKYRRKVKMLERMFR
jgi:rhomboid protease GluP